MSPTMNRSSSFGPMTRLRVSGRRPSPASTVVVGSLSLTIPPCPPRPLPPQSWQLRMVSELRPVCISPADQRTDAPRARVRSAGNASSAADHVEERGEQRLRVALALRPHRLRLFDQSIFVEPQVPQLLRVPAQNVRPRRLRVELGAPGPPHPEGLEFAGVARGQQRRLGRQLDDPIDVALQERRPLPDRGEHRVVGRLGGGADIGVSLLRGSGPGPHITTDDLGDELPAEADPQLRQVRVEAVTDEFGLLGEPGSAIGLIGHVSAAERDQPVVALQRARCGQGRDAADAQIELDVLADHPLCQQPRLGVDVVDDDEQPGHDSTPAEAAVTSSADPRNRVYASSWASRTRIALSKPSLRRSACDQPREASSAKRFGYCPASPRPVGSTSTPQMSPPRPTWSRPILSRTLSQWSPASATVTSGAVPCSPVSTHSRRAFETKEGTKVIIATPPFPGTRSRTSSGMLRGCGLSPKAQEWLKITGRADRSSDWCMTEGA